MCRWKWLTVGVVACGIAYNSLPDYVTVLKNAGYKDVTLHGYDFGAINDCFFNSTFKSSQGAGTVCYYLDQYGGYYGSL
jgi:hypothetical protein